MNAKLIENKIAHDRTSIDRLRNEYWWNRVTIIFFFLLFRGEALTLKSIQHEYPFVCMFVLLHCIIIIIIIIIISTSLLLLLLLLLHVLYYYHHQEISTYYYRNF